MLKLQIWNLVQLFLREPYLYFLKILLVKSWILAYETLDIYVTALKRNPAWKGRYLFPWNIKQFLFNIVSKSCHSRYKIINRKLFSSFTYEVMPLTITEFFIIFNIIMLKIRRDKPFNSNQLCLCLGIRLFYWFQVFSCMEK